MKNISPKKISLLILIFFTHCSFREIKTRAIATAHSAPCIPTDMLLFDTAFLAHYDTVAATLIAQENFQEISFTTDDSLTLNGLWRSHPHASCTFIFCAGFYPGRKEGLASFIRIVPSDCNILFFDARGHGKSEGKFFSNITRYGLDEYRDIIAAINFAHKQSNAPIMVHGICAGAFHAAHAFIKMGPDTIRHYNIKGLIFDSGIASITDALRVPEEYVAHKIIPNLLLSWFTHENKQTIKERLACKILSSFSSCCLAGIRFLVAPYMHKHAHQTTLINTIHTINCPILFIHARNDTYSPFEAITALAKNTQSSSYWWINQSEHALNQFKHTQEYKKRVHLFMQNNLLDAKVPG